MHSEETMNRLSLLTAVFLFAMGQATIAAASPKQNGSDLLSHSSAPSAFSGGRTLRYDGLAITLMSYKLVTGLVQYPEGPPARPHKGDRFVTTLWRIQDTTNHAVPLGLWIANSAASSDESFSDVSFDGFVSGISDNVMVVPPRATVRDYWDFEVARAHKIELYYVPAAHWVPRDK
jgi:hypothetical protein